MNTTQRHILEAADQIVQRDGVAHLTIEAVAREAGLSKGGVLYHFASKEALVNGMIALLLEDFDRDLAQALTQEDNSSGQWLRAYISASSNLPEEEYDPNIGLIAAIGTDPCLLKPIRESYRTWQERVEHDGLPPALATILRLAVDGLWFADFLGFASPQGKLREEVIQTLLKMARNPQE